MNRKNDQLKVIGLIVMVVDHVSLFLYGGDPWLFAIARFIGFPFFAYGIAVGSRYTRDPVKYLSRLVIFGIFCQPFFYLATDQARLNVCFTLALGVVAVRLWHSGLYRWKLVAAVLPLVGGPLMDPAVGYGAYGVYMILAFGIGPAAAAAFFVVSSLYLAQVGNIQCLAAFSLFFIYWLPVPRIQLPRWVYYSSYPSHLAVIAGIRYLV